MNRRLLAMASLLVAGAVRVLMADISTSTLPSVIIPPNYWVAIVPFSDICSSETAVVILPSGIPPAVSTGPFIMKSPTTPDCYKIDYVNSNGTTVPPGPIYPWSPCQ